MSMGGYKCKNKCEHIKIKKGSEYLKSRDRYLNGLRYCQQCECYFKTEHLRCICCGIILRTKPRRSKERMNFVNRKFYHLLEIGAA